MQQLSGLDASFLYFETANASTHIGSFSLYDPSGMPGGRLSFEQLLANIEGRLHLARCFRQKLARVPLDLDHPYWIEDADFDLEFHVRHIALPKPGSWRQLCEQAARLHARPLDLSRPLWELYLIEGIGEIPNVPAGAFAILMKVHHAAIDGVSGMELMAAIHDTTPEAAPPPPAKRWQPERDPSALELLGRAAANNLRSPFRLGRVLAQTVPGIRRYVAEQRRSRIEETGETPRTRFNGAVTPHRVLGGVAFDLGEIREIRKCVTGATVNDVVLTVCGGALRAYLDAKKELPKESLIAMCPVSVRREDEKGSAGNQVSTMSVAIRSDIADPLERLQAVTDASRQSKKLTEAIGARSLTDMTQFVPGGLAGLGWRAASQLGLANRVRPFLNTVITNVPGPQFPLYMSGAKLITQFGMGPVMDGMGIIHPIGSYNGGAVIAFTSCRELLPDPEFYEACIRDAFAALREATIGAPPEEKPRAELPATSAA
jgi:WS/DGAT/MGAT family acyltransferase